MDDTRATLDVLLKERRDTEAAERFFRTLLGATDSLPGRMITDELGSYAAAKVRSCRSASPPRVRLPCSPPPDRQSSGGSPPLRFAFLPGRARECDTAARSARRPSRRLYVAALICPAPCPKRPDSLIRSHSAQSLRRWDRPALST